MPDREPSNSSEQRHPGRYRKQPWSELDDYDRASLATDCVLLTVEDRQLYVLVHRRRDEPEAGRWALPGVFVDWPEREDDAVRRALKTKTLLDFGGHLEHLDWASDPERDARGWVITHTFLGLAAASDLRRTISADAGDGALSDVALAAVLPSHPGESLGPVHVHLPEGVTEHLAFDHNLLVGQAVGRLRGKLRYTDVGLHLVPDEFTLRELQEAWETVLGEPLNKATFRKLVTDLGHLEPAGAWEPEGAGHRRAQLYRRRS